MPNCPTCRGEYTREECVCPVCGKPLGRSSDLCHSCGAEIRGKRSCPRCKRDVSVWEKESLSLSHFIAKGGFVGLLPTVAAAIMWVFFWGRQENSIHHPIGSVLGIMLSLLVFSALFSRRYVLREMVWAAEIHQVLGPSPAFIGTGSFLAGLFLMVAAVTLYKLWQPPEYFWEKLVFAAVYGPAYVGFTGGLTLLPLGGYLSSLDERVPQPIFVHTDRLIEVVLQTTAKSLRGREEGQTIDRQMKNFEVLEVARNPIDGSIQMLVKEHKSVGRPESNANLKDQKREQTWAIYADKWGRIRSLKPRL